MVAEGAEPTLGELPAFCVNPGEPRAQGRVTITNFNTLKEIHEQTSHRSHSR